MSRIQKTDAIVLRRLPFRNTSLLVTFYTRSFGKVKLICKGIHQKKSPLIAYVEPGVYQEIVFYYRPAQEITVLADSTLKESFSFIRNDLRRLCMASYFVDLVDEVTPLHQRHSELFDLLLLALCELKEEASTNLALFFTLRLLDLVGLFPNMDMCTVCRATIAEQSVLFSLRQGGLVCQREYCRTHASDALDISAAGITAIQSLKQGTALPDWCLHLERETQEELFRLVQKWITYQLGHELRSMKVIMDMRLREEQSV